MRYSDRRQSSPGLRRAVVESSVSEWRQIHRGGAEAAERTQRNSALSRRSLRLRGEAKPAASLSLSRTNSGKDARRLDESNVA